MLSEPVKMAHGFCCQMSVYVAVLRDAAAISVKCTNDCDVGLGV